VVGEDHGVPDANPDQDGASEGLAQLGDDLVIEGQCGELVRARGKDERPRPEVEAVSLLDEVAAGEKSVGQLLDGGLGRTQRACQLGQGHATWAQGHGLEDPGHSVDGAVRARWHALTLASPARTSERSCQ
jgi:hypothetical protein